MSKAYVVVLEATESSDVIAIFTEDKYKKAVELAYEIEKELDLSWQYVEIYELELNHVYENVYKNTYSGANQPKEVNWKK